MASSSSITPSSSKMYDVFLSARGYKDNKFYSFSRHLYDVLCKNNISIFTEYSLEGLNEREIEGSRISVIIFTESFASSKWRLNELVKVLECREKYNQIVIPVFYDIDPSDVRDQTGPFAEALKKYEANFLDNRSVPKWRVALTEASNLPGYNLSEFKSKAALRRLIVDDILEKLGRCSVVDILNRYRVHKDEKELYVDIVNFIKRYSGHKDEEEDNGDEDKEALHDDKVDKREQDSGHKDEDELLYDIVNIIKRYSGYIDEDQLDFEIGTIMHRLFAQKEKDKLRYDIGNIGKLYSGHEDEEEDSGDEDEEAIHNVFLSCSDELPYRTGNIGKRYSGHEYENEEAIHNVFLSCKDELPYGTRNIRKRYSGHEDEEEEAIHDVFLSCSDEYSPYSFTTHLYVVLLGNKISTLIDDSRLQRGDEISPALLNAIGKSRISLIIFSKDYAGSRLCLDKLVRILECREKDKQIVIPVFYDIDPSDVRDQTGPLAEAFKKHEASFDETSSVPKWRVALTEASNLPGYNLSEFISEVALTDAIVGGILEELDKDGEAGDNKDTREQNRGDSGGGGGGGGAIFIEMSGELDKDGEAGDNKDTREQNRGDGDGGGDGRGGGGGDGVGDGGGDGVGGGDDGVGDGGGDGEGDDPKWFQRITAERIFVTTNLILEILSVVFDTLSSVHKPQYALVSMSLSFAAMLICIIQLAYNGGKARVGWRWRPKKIPWFYYPSPSDKPFGTVTDFIGLICAIVQSIFTARDCALYLRQINDPIKISVWPIVFSFCLAWSTFYKESSKEDSKKSAVTIEILEKKIDAMMEKTMMMEKMLKAVGEAVGVNSRLMIQSGSNGLQQSGSSSPQTLQQTGSNGQQSGSSSPQTL